MNKAKIIIALLALFSFSSLMGKDCFPDYNSKNLVYDETGIFSSSEKVSLNKYLIGVSNSTSNQIVVVAVKDLCGQDKASYATELGHKWGVGRKGKDNGIVILIKPTGGKGQRKTFIAVGYGLEGVIPDATAKLVVENEMIPHFKKKDFYGGVQAALGVLVPLAKGEFNYEAYKPRKSRRARGKKINWFSVAIFGFFAIIFIIARVGRARTYARTNNIDPWTAFWMGSMIGGMGGSGRSSGWDDFSSGGGGFGGFGGGGFGGGGAGGDW